MCEYCKNADTGDDIREIISARYDCGLFGSVDIDVAILRNDGNPILGASIDTATASRQALTPISYCPMCGRKF